MIDDVTHVVGIVTFDLIGLLPTNHIIAYNTMAYAGICEETFDINSKIAQTTQNFIVGKSNLQEMANFGDFLRDFRLLSGDREKRFKILSLSDYPGELTAL